MDLPKSGRNRLEEYLLYLCGKGAVFPLTPRNRLECFLDYLCKHAGGGSISPYNSTPANLGPASAGSSDDYARGDHVHAMPTAAQIGAYAKPSGGIPKSDLASEVQTSLGKADTALQEHQSLASYRTAAAQDAIDDAQDTAIAAKYTKPDSGIPASDLADGIDNVFIIPATAESIAGTSPTEYTASTDVTMDEVNAAFQAGKTLVLEVTNMSNGVSRSKFFALAGQVSTTTAGVVNGVRFGGLFWTNNSAKFASVQAELKASGLTYNQKTLKDVYPVLSADLSTKLDVAQGTENAGKFLVVGSDGNITTMAMTAWQGGNY